MAEDLDDGEFWLPSHFLTDDDILMDFDFSPEKPGSGLGGGGMFSDHGFSSNSDLEFTSGSTETESDEEDIMLSGLTRQMGRVAIQDDASCPVHSNKGTVLSSSPQSTLCRCLCNQGSSRDSPSGPVSPPQPPPQEDENDNNATLDLLNKAAGEVARLKLKTDNNNNNSNKSTGTGFFDCSQKGVLYPAPLRNPDHFPPLYFQPQFHRFPPMVWSPSVGAQYNQQKQPPPPQHNRATKNNNVNNKNNVNNNRPLGLPPSAWPPLKPQAQTQPQNPAQKMAPPAPMFSGPKRESVGTGVFLPRRVTTPPPESRKKYEGNTPKAKSGKGSQQSQSNNRRTPRATTTPTAVANQSDIQLPQEWTY